MHRLIVTFAVCLAATTGTSVVVHPEDLIGDWQDHDGTLYVFRENHTMDRRYSDYDWGPRAHWELSGRGTIEISDPQKRSEKTLIRITGFGRNIIYLRWPDGTNSVWVKTSNRPNKAPEPTPGRRDAHI